MPNDAWISGHSATQAEPIRPSEMEEHQKKKKKIDQIFRPDSIGQFSHLRVQARV